MRRVLKAKVFDGPETVKLARSLLGKLLVLRQADGSTLEYRIREAEAYDGPSDRACHASRGRTARTSVLFGPPGHWYVYLCYGIHEMLNLVTGPQDYPAAVLIRGVEGLMGPGRVTKGLGIDRRFNARPAAPDTGLWLEDDGVVPPPSEVLVTPRIGVDYAGAEWASKPWRFVWPVTAAATLPARRRRRAR